MSQPIEAVVTGVGPVSAIGSGRNDYWTALLEGRSGFGPITLCDVSTSPSKIGAEVRDFRLRDYVANGELLERRTPRPVQLALASAVLALHDAEIDLDACDPDRMGVQVGTSIGNLGDLLTLNRKLTETGAVPAHTAFHAFHHSAACVVSSFFNIRGPIHTTSSGCNSGIDGLGQSVRMIQAGAVDAMLVIGTDCELVPEVLAALNASGSLTTRYNDDPTRASRPFDRDRDGNVIGEGAAAVLLEAAPHAQRRRARAYAKVAGYRIASAGQNRQYSHDRPELDLRPAVRAMKGAIDEAGWRAVDVVNANGSSSVIYDRAEALALAEVLGPKLEKTPVHSIKSMLGQHGAGSSMLQVVTSCLTLRRGTIPPTTNHENPDPACGPIRVLTEPLPSWPTRALVHSIGLGGFYYSAAALEAVEDEAAMQTGMVQVRWSEQHHPRFQPAEEFQRPLVPWNPRRDPDNQLP
ncbi:MAG: beta-ketoacyl-[acyl-carrier-protein] synthase family protein [Candidatus Eisenbacteria bacterium]|uniref:Beta-ketoacyl-[acyl-carrier-protein] synthase family protein n=1 Tax=Eiseniibacteriota bacterium TaxID=2212470 RepID=A0A956LYF6_UNCEI|nr:beta-ketoacyl-[acyl-carrier-protein] synthase family protein [Candidatus Eisenbacteria bacterium]